MFSIELLAWLCITGFCGENVYYIPDVHEKCMELLYNYECLDAQELKMYREYGKNNVYWMNYSVAINRYDMMKDCPYIYVINRYPPVEIIDANLKRNVEVDQYLTAQLETCRSYEVSRLQEAKDYNAKLYTFWTNVKYAKSENWYIYTRRQSIQECINIIGLEQFLFGDFPPYQLGLVPFGN